MMLYASTHFANVAGPNHTPPAIAAVPLNGVSDQDRIVSAVKRTKASVVAITETINGQQVVPTDPFIQQFFGQRRPGKCSTTRGRPPGRVSSIDDQGRHRHQRARRNAAEGGKASKLTVVFSNGDQVPAHVVAANIGADLAVIKVDNYAKLPPPLDLADSDKLEQGQWAIAIGEPLRAAADRDASASFRPSTATSDRRPRTAATDIRLQRPLPDVGPDQSRQFRRPADRYRRPRHRHEPVDREAARQGIGFAIPSNTVRTVVPQLLSTRASTRAPTPASSAFAPVDMTAGFSNQIGYNGPGGLGVVQVVSGLARRQGWPRTRRRDPPGRRQAGYHGRRARTNTSPPRSQATPSASKSGRKA